MSQIDINRALLGAVVVLCVLVVALHRPEKLSLPQVQEHTAYLTTQGGAGRASGVWISPRRVLTAGHVARGTRPITVSLGGQTVRLSQEWVKESESIEDDVGVLTIGSQKSAALSTFPELNCEPLSLGQKYWVSGHAIDLRVVSSIQVVGGPEPDRAPSLTVRGPLVPGMSGAGVWNGRGQLVGIVTAAFVLDNSMAGGLTQTGLGFVLPASAFCPWLREAGMRRE